MNRWTPKEALVSYDGPTDRINITLHEDGKIEVQMPAVEDENAAAPEYALLTVGFCALLNAPHGRALLLQLTTSAVDLAKAAKGT